jgi:cephalosporin hydroxylase
MTNVIKTLHELCDKHKIGLWPDKGDVHSYLDVYAEIFAPYREKAKNILEIGLMSGESLRMWSDYFSGKVYGMDCDIKPIGGLADLSECISEGYNVKIGDATNPSIIKEFFEGIKFDVIIEDAGHGIDQQLTIYEVFKPYLSKGSIYVIEDVQDIDASRESLENIDSNKNVVVLDQRSIKNRYDDVLILITDK